MRHLATNQASSQPESLETWVTAKDHFTPASPPHPSNRLQHAQVRHALSVGNTKRHVTVNVCETSPRRP